jgi:prevent-host-death family protein
MKELSFFEVGGRDVPGAKQRGMKQVPPSEAKDDLLRYLREAEKDEVVITRHGNPAGVLIGFESEEDWFEYRRSA